jgi:outer membrane immunogenic protein
VKKFLLVTAVAAVLAAPAQAADMLVKAPPVAAEAYSWSGCYVGANVGGGWGRTKGELDNFGGPGTIIAVNGGGIPRTLDIHSSGVIGGGQLGCNWQSTNLVWGLVTDVQGSGIRGSNSFFFPGGVVPAGVLFPITTTGTERMNWFGTVRGRLGFAPTQRSLLYVTGGFAFGDVRNTASIVTAPGTANFNGTVSGTKAGWTVGAGGEHAFAGNWSAFAEFLYVDLQSTVVRALDPAFPTAFLDYRFQHRDYVGRVGLNYRFGGPVVARY